MVDRDDRCQGPKGTLLHAGCADTDGDGKIDPDDACPREKTRGKRDRNENGCPDRELLKPEIKLTPGLYCTGSICHGVRVNKLVDLGDPPRHARRRLVHEARLQEGLEEGRVRSTSVRFFNGQALDAGVGLRSRCRGSGYVRRRVTYWIKPNDWKKTATPA